MAALPPDTVSVEILRRIRRKCRSIQKILFKYKQAKAMAALPPDTVSVEILRRIRRKC
jgi:hypothetical protein